MTDRRTFEPPEDKGGKSSADNKIGVVKGASPFGGAFDSGDAYQARMQARDAINAAIMPKNNETVEIDLGSQGAVQIRRSGGEESGKLTLVLNGKQISSVDFSRFNPKTKTVEDAFAEAKRRIGYYVWT